MLGSVVIFRSLRASMSKKSLGNIDLVDTDVVANS
jgi:hypothetical protein